MASADIASAVGPLLLGTLISWLLMGIYTMQAHAYFMRYADKFWIRSLVITISFLEIAQWIILTADAWYYLVTNWGNLAVYFIIPWPALVLVVLCGISSMIVQSFYAWRIWMISYDAWLLRIAAFVIEGLSLMQGCSAITGAVLVFQRPTEAEIARRHRFFDAWLIGNLATDSLISFCMLWILFKARNSTHWQNSKLMFDKLIVNTVKTGSATTIIAALTLILFDLFRDRNYYGTTFNFLQKLYSISLLANLNARQKSGTSRVEEEPQMNFSDIIIRTSTSTHASSSNQDENQNATYPSLRALQERSFPSGISKTLSSSSRTKS
ncbi:hypothetical protein C8F04DRAFT_409725 [Mycena alexandri]|uniref:DUF6534 domain-containing protein n=1 Tax=Mycena alexandri TaxID=1745969 RepID=A0AAD6X9S3_9AGAR|nr:hypothetical protein C8F04DRAFT_409725 [Mycena alexandri]